jgi:hypothetical protein
MGLPVLVQRGSERKRVACAAQRGNWRYMGVRVVAGAVITSAVAVWLWVLRGPFSADHAVGLGLAVAALVGAGVLVAKSRTALLFGAAFALSVAVVWYASYNAGTTDSGPLDGVVLALIALVVATGALGAGTLVARLFE